MEGPMPSDPRKRQKKLERRTARRKQKKHTLVRAQSAGLPGQLSAASKYPVLYCWIMEEGGIANVHLSREFPNGQVAAANFLVDTYCLGVKDCWAEVLHRTDYDNKYRRERNPDMLPYRDIPPAEARRFIEQAVEYAAGIGFPPHPDCDKAMLLFGDIDPNDSDAVFEFGKDGKPLFIAGPNDTPERSKRIIAILMNNCGPDQFHFVAPIGGDEYIENVPGGYPPFGDDEDDTR
jgi:hypothetical protein